MVQWLKRCEHFVLYVRKNDFIVKKKSVTGNYGEFSHVRFVYFSIRSQGRCVVTQIHFKSHSTQLWAIQFWTSNSYSNGNMYLINLVSRFENLNGKETYYFLHYRKKLFTQQLKGKGKRQRTWKTRTRNENTAEIWRHDVMDKWKETDFASGVQD